MKVLFVDIFSNNILEISRQITVEECILAIKRFCREHSVYITALNKATFENYYIIDIGSRNYFFVIK